MSMKLVFKVKNLLFYARLIYIRFTIYNLYYQQYTMILENVLLAATLFLFCMVLCVYFL